MIYKGSQKEGTVDKGNTKFSKIYKGNQLVYQKISGVTLFWLSNFNDYYGNPRATYALAKWASDACKVGDFLNPLTATITSISGTIGQGGSSVNVQGNSISWFKYRMTIDGVHVYSSPNGATGQAAILGNPIIFVLNNSVVGSTVLATQANYNGLYWDSVNPNRVGDLSGYTQNPAKNKIWTINGVY